MTHLNPGKGELTLYEGWQDDGNNSRCVFAPAHLSAEMRDNPTLAEDPSKAHRIWSYWGWTWEETMQAWHAFNGWEPYVSWDERHGDKG